MPIPRRRTAAALLGLSGLLLLACRHTAEAQGNPPIRLLTHKATYTLALDRTRPSGNLAAADGKAEYTLEQTSCSWYRSVTTLSVTFRGTNGTRMAMLSTTEVQEKAGGTEMQFKTQRLQDGKQVQASEGSARRAAGRVSIRTVVPQVHDFDVTDDVQFPVQQLVAVLEAAGSGRTQTGGRLYDGTDTGLKLYRVTAQIGSQTSRRMPAIGTAQPAWPVAVGYFADTAAPSNFPEHELSTTLLQNGVYSDLRFNFRDFALTGTMADLSAIPPGDCD